MQSFGSLVITVTLFTIALMGPAAAEPPTVQVDVGGPVRSVRVHGELAVVAAGTAGVALVDIATGEVVAKQELPGDPTGADTRTLQAGVAGSEAGPMFHEIVAISQLDTGMVVSILDPRSLAEKRTFAGPRTAHALTVSGTLAVMHADAGVTAIDLGAERVLWHTEIPAQEGGLAVSGDRVILSHAFPGGLKVLDIATGEILEDHEQPIWLRGVAVAGDVAFATPMWGDAVQASDVKTGRVLERVEGSADTIAAVDHFLMTVGNEPSNRLVLRDRDTLEAFRILALEPEVVAIAHAGDRVVLDLGWPGDRDPRAALILTSAGLR